MGCILLVEDEPAAAALIARYLERSGVSSPPVLADSAGRALELARSREVDLFLLDIQLPDYQGTVLARQIRAMPEYRFTPLLFTTEVAEAELDAYREFKCFSFLVKPFTQAEFAAAVSSALEMGRRMVPPPAVLRVEQKQFVFEYEIRSILYIESFGKQTVIHTAVGGRVLEDRISGWSLMRFLEQAGPGRLVQCHKSYLINPDRLERIDRSRRLLWLRECPDPIPIGEKYQGNLRKERPG